MAGFVGPGSAWALLVDPARIWITRYLAFVRQRLNKFIFALTHLVIELAILGVKPSMVTITTMGPFDPG